MAHMKRYRIERFVPIPKKENKWVVRPAPGPHPLRFCIALQTLVKDVLGYASGSQEARKIIKAGKILVDKKERKDPKFPVGLMDSIEIPEMNEQFRVLVDNHGLKLEKMDKDDAGKKLCKIISKRNLRGGVFQISLHDGRNIRVKENAYKPGDSLMIGLPDQNVLKHFKLEKGSQALVIAGTNMGISGKVKAIGERKTMLKKATVTLEIEGGTIETLREYILVGGSK